MFILEKHDRYCFIWWFNTPKARFSVIHNIYTKIFFFLIILLSCTASQHHPFSRIFCVDLMTSVPVDPKNPPWWCFYFKSLYHHWQSSNITQFKWFRAYCTSHLLHICDMAWRDITWPAYVLLHMFFFLQKILGYKCRLYVIVYKLRHITS